MNTIVRTLLITLLATLLLAGCRSTKNATKDADKAPEPICLTAKLKVNGQFHDKSMTLSGNLKMKTGQVIRISLVALGLMEVARLEMTPDEFLLLDRMNKRYCRAKYNEVDFLKERDLDFNKIQNTILKALNKKDNKAFSLGDSGRKMKLDITVLSTDNDCNWPIHTTISSRYTAVDIADLIEMLSKTH